MGQNKKLIRFRKLLMFLWVILLPITFNWMSPVLIIMGGFEGYITMSFLIFAIWFFSSLIIGRAYCAYSCQWGACQEILDNTIPKKLDLDKKKTRRKIKYIVFVIWIVFIALGPILNLGYAYGLNLLYPSLDEGLMAIVSFHEVQITQLIFYFGIIGSVVILFTLVGGKRSFCSYACPMGVLGILGTKIKNSLKYPSLHLEPEVEKCTQCKQCSKACEMGLDVNELVEKGDMYHPDCILCGSCVSTCPQNVINYAWKWRK